MASRSSVAAIVLLEGIWSCRDPRSARSGAPEAGATLPVVQTESDAAPAGSVDAFDVLARGEDRLDAGDVGPALYALRRAASIADAGWDHALRGRAWLALGRAYDAKGPAYAGAARYAYQRAVDQLPESDARASDADARMRAHGGRKLACLLEMDFAERAAESVPGWRALHDRLRRAALAAGESALRDVKTPETEEGARDTVCMPTCASGVALWPPPDASDSRATKCPAHCRGDGPWVVALREPGGSAHFGLAAPNGLERLWVWSSIGEPAVLRRCSSEYEFTMDRVGSIAHLRRIETTAIARPNPWGGLGTACFKANFGWRSDVFFNVDRRTQIVATTYTSDHEQDDPTPRAVLSRLGVRLVDADLSIVGLGCDQVLPLR